MDSLSVEGPYALVCGFLRRGRTPGEMGIKEKTESRPAVSVPGGASVLAGAGAAGLRQA